MSDTLPPPDNPDRDKERDRDDTPETPTDEPTPEPVRDPPAEPGPQGPYVVRGYGQSDAPRVLRGMSGLTASNGGNE
jgi:hypothetical protein